MEEDMPREAPDSPGVANATAGCAAASGEAGCGVSDAGAPTHIRLYGTAPDSIVDGPGLRYAVFTQGCSHGCPGCHNPDSHPADGGTLTSIDALVADIRANGLVHDVTLSGGDPFEQPEACAEVARRLKAAGYGLWAYTGFLYEDLLAQAEAASDATPQEAVRAAAVASLLATVDVLVDGPFVESLKSLGLKWRGSSNQRLIDLAATRRAGRVVEWRSADFSLEKPSNW